MVFKKFILVCFVLLYHMMGAQNYTPDAFYIKSFQFEGLKESAYPFFKLGSRISFSFDDLMGNEAVFSYKIIHCDKDWKPSSLRPSEYINGISQNNIQNIENSFTTFQSYSHSRVSIPNGNQRILISGNYLLELYNQYNDLVLTRKFIVYEEMVSVQLEARRTRDLRYEASMQNIKATVDLGSVILQQPQNFVRLEIYQNARFDRVKLLKPQYILGSKLMYNYDLESSFFGGSEYRHFDNGEIRSPNYSVVKVELKDLFETYLYPEQSFKGKKYSFSEDINGAFFPYVRFKERNVFNTEADYSWVYFSLDYPKQDKPIYIVGMFNNYCMSEDFEMDYNEETKRYELPILLKQGFTDYTYQLGRVYDENANLLGDFSETENMYHAFVYYQTPTDRYERVIGMGNVRAINLIND